MRPWLQRTIERLTSSKRPAPRSWEVPLDTREARHLALDWALLNVQICTRAEHDDQEDSLRGDYLEFGVFEGNSFLHAHHRGRRRMPWMRFFAFDSFEGLPEPEGFDEGGEFHGGQFACSQSRFEQNLREQDADMTRIRVIPGWYDASLTQDMKHDNQLEVCSVAMIDCDLHASTVPVMAFLTDLLRTGSILLFDDWYNFRGDPDRGVRRATRDWLEEHPHITLETWHPFCHHGQSFIVNVGERA